jgi:ATP-binding cassette subfamily B protein
MKIFKFILSSSKDFKLVLLSMIGVIFLLAIDANIRPYIIKLLINQNDNFELWSFIKLSSIYLFFQAIMVVGNSLFDWLGTIYHTNYRSKIAHIYFEHLSKYPYSFFQETEAGSISTRISDAFNSIPVIVFLTMHLFLQFFIFTTIATIFLYSVNYVFAVSALIWIAVFLLLTWMFYDKYTPYKQAYAKCKPNIFGYLADYFSNISSVWAFNNLSLEKKKLTNLTEEFKQKGQSSGKFLALYYLMYGFIITAYMAFIMSYIGYLSTQNLITGGDFAFIFMINFKIVDKLFEISGKFVEYLNLLGTVENAIKLLEEENVIEDNSGAKELVFNEGSIDFENVCFSYNNTAKLFNNLSIWVKPKQKVGLVGYTGSGKTSFINLLLNFFKVDSGTITIDQQNINEVTIQSLRRYIALIPQDPPLFHRNILENIRYGNPRASDEDVMEAARLAQAEEFIAKLSEGYNTLVGERGIKLSGGQKQRIAIARVILKNAPILLMDEATSQLDSVTENFIQQSMSQLISDKTSIIIAHRLSTLLHMDRIVVFDNGEIVEDGSHKELLAKNGVYKTLWNSQSNGFLPVKTENN